MTDFTVHAVAVEVARPAPADLTAAMVAVEVAHFTRSDFTVSSVAVEILMSVATTPAPAVTRRRVFFLTS